VEFRRGVACHTEAVEPFGGGPDKGRRRSMAKTCRASRRPPPARCASAQYRRPPPRGRRYGLGDGLVLGDGQGRIFIAEFLEAFLHERLARHGLQRLQDAGIGNPAPGKMPLDHPAAGMFIIKHETLPVTSIKPFVGGIVPVGLPAWSRFVHSSRISLTFQY
jgi:hypothetical protein